MCEKIEFAPHSQLSKLSFNWNDKTLFSRKSTLMNE
jgi:hypothetical protein